MTVARFPARRKWRLLSSDASEGLHGWQSGLRSVSFDELAEAARRAQVEGLIAAHAPTWTDFLTRSLRENWAQVAYDPSAEGNREVPPGVPRFILRAPDGKIHEVMARGPIVRFGSGASCHVVCPTDGPEIGVADEHLELRIEYPSGDGSAEVPADVRVSVIDLGSDSGTQLNGRALGAHDPHSVAQRDEVSFAGFSVIFAEVGSAVDEHADSSTTEVEVAEIVVAGPEDPFQRWGSSSGRWMPILVAGRRGYVHLAESWTEFAYRALGYPLPAAAGFDNAVDLELTRFAADRVLRGLARRAGVSLTSGQLATAAELPIDRAVSEVGVVGVRLKITAAGEVLDCTALWPATEPPRAAASRAPASEQAAEWCGALEFPVTVELGDASLPVEQLVDLVEGDVILPDRWLGAHSHDHEIGGPVRLRTGDWEFGAELVEHEGGAVVQIRSGSWECRPKGGEVMSSQQLSPPESGEKFDSGRGPIEEELEVLVTFELDRLSVPLRELGAWTEGSTVQLKRSANEPIRILLHDGAGARVIGRGEVVLIEDEVGIRIDEWWSEPESEDRGSA